LPKTFDYSAADASATDVGRCVRVPFGQRELTGVIVAVVENSDCASARIREVIAIQRDVAALPEAWLALVHFASQYYQAPLGEVIAMALPPQLRRAQAVSGQEHDPLLQLTASGQHRLTLAGRRSQVRALAEYVQQHGAQRRSVLRDHASSEAIRTALQQGWLAHSQASQPEHAEGALPLTPAQQTALERLGNAQQFAVFLLYGVTGSGKTEVYLQRMQQTLAQGQQVLFLVPEIALTPQLEQRVSQRFPQARMVSLHSGLAEARRSKGFVQAMVGEAEIILGTRLAVFTPLPRLGLVVVDEEHDPSYKQQEGIRYSARDLAIWRAHQHNIPIILGSATPSLETWHHATTGRYHKLELGERAIATTLPTVRCLDTRRAALHEGFSPTLLHALEARLARQEQSLVFLNRRGFAPVLTCTACGWISRCEFCSANRVVHLNEKRLRCHHCGTASSIPIACPHCGNQDIHPLGRGTQRLEAALIARFPHARILRLDRDSASTRQRWENLLAQISRHEVDILIGTQLMAKGHDFPKLTLVGVLNADSGLFAADFRASERLMQQLIQVGGRAGRAELPGEVLVQTDYPDHPVYQAFIRHDYPGFAAQELRERQLAGFPPHTFQATLRADAPKLEDALHFLAQAQQLAHPWLTPELVIYDAVPMRMTRLAARERAQLLVEASQRTFLQRFLSQWSEALYQLKPIKELRWQLDVDPLEV
jgi:primosomal protein N' (replication factor Y)